MREEESDQRREQFARTGMHVVPLAQNEIRANHGDSSNIQRGIYARRLESVLQSQKPTEPGPCPIQGCHNHNLTPDHKCHGVGCSKYVHNWCTQEFNLGGHDPEALEFYCCISCKNSK